MLTGDNVPEPSVVPLSMKLMEPVAAGDLGRTCAVKLKLDPLTTGFALDQIRTAGVEVLAHIDNDENSTTTNTMLLFQMKFDIDMKDRFSVNN